MTDDDFSTGYVEEMFNGFARYQENSVSALYENEVELEGDDMEVMIPSRWARLPSERFYGRCMDNGRTDNKRMDDFPSDETQNAD